MRTISCIHAIVILVSLCFNAYAGVIRGKVLVKYNNQPVASAGIDLLKRSIFDPAGVYHYEESTTTDANGNYEFRTGTDGYCALSLHSPYCYPKDTVIGFFQTMTIQTFDFLVERKGEITVKVVNAITQNALPNATVLLYGPLWSSNGRIPGGLLVDSLITNANGICVFTGICAEPDYMIHTSAAKFIDRTDTVAPMTDGGARLEFAYLSPMTGIITGTVKNVETNGVISGATVIRMSAPSIGRPMPIDTVYSSVRGGTYAFNNVTIGNYRIKTVKKGYSDTLSGVVSVIKDDDSVFVPTVMRPVYMYVTGTITKTGTTAPIAGAFLSIKLFPHNLFGSGNLFTDTADASGNYGFKFLKAYDSAKVYGAASGYLPDSGKIIFSLDTTKFSFSLSASLESVSPESLHKNGFGGSARGGTLQVFSLSGKLLQESAIADDMTKHCRSEGRKTGQSVVVKVIRDKDSKIKQAKRATPRF